MNKFPAAPFDFLNPSPLANVGDVYVYEGIGGTYLYSNTSNGWSKIGQNHDTTGSFDVDLWIKKSLAKRQSVREVAVARLTQELLQAQEELSIIRSARKETIDW